MFLTWYVPGGSPSDSSRLARTRNVAKENEKRRETHGLWLQGSSSFPSVEPRGADEATGSWHGSPLPEGKETPVEPEDVKQARLIDARRLSHWIGISPQSIRALVRAGELPYYRVGGVYRFSLTEVLDYLRAGDDR